MSSWLDGEQAVSRRKAEAEALARQYAHQPAARPRRQWLLFLRPFFARRSESVASVKRLQGPNGGAMSSAAQD